VVSLKQNQVVKFNGISKCTSCGGGHKVAAVRKYGRGNITEFALRSGFNSRTTFYSTIKKLNCVSPVSLVNRYKKTKEFVLSRFAGQKPFFPLFFSESFALVFQLTELLSGTIRFGGKNEVLPEKKKAVNQGFTAFWMI